MAQNNKGSTKQTTKVNKAPALQFDTICFRESGMIVNCQKANLRPIKGLTRVPNYNEIT